MSGSAHLLLLPGLHGNDELWAPLLASIPASVPRTVVTYPSDRVLTRSELLEVIEEAAPADGRLVVIGESFSGPLAVEFAARQRERVMALVLCATFVRPPLPEWMCRMAAVLARCFKRPLYRMRGWLPDRLADATVGRTERDALRHVEAKVIASRLRMVAETDCGELLCSFPAPILYLRGTRDFVVQSRCLREIQRLRSDVRVKMLDCSHMVFQRKPAEAWQAIEELCAELYRKGGRELKVP